MTDRSLVGKNILIIGPAIACEFGEAVANAVVNYTGHNYSLEVQKMFKKCRRQIDAADSPKALRLFRKLEKYMSPSGLWAVTSTNLFTSRLYYERLLHR